MQSATAAERHLQNGKPEQKRRWRSMSHSSQTTRISCRWASWVFKRTFFGQHPPTKKGIGFAKQHLEDTMAKAPTRTPLAPQKSMLTLIFFFWTPPLHTTRLSPQHCMKGAWGGLRHTHAVGQYLFLGGGVRDKTQITHGSTGKPICGNQNHKWSEAKIH